MGLSMRSAARPHTQQGEIRLARSGPRKISRRYWKWFVAAAVLVLVAAIVLLNHYWPFTRNHLVHELEQATSSHVTLGSFRHTLFPRPGCVAEQVILTRGETPATQAKMTIRTLTVEGNWTGLLNKHLALMRLEGADAVFPPIGTGEEWKPSNSEIVIDELIADGSLLEFKRRNEQVRNVQFPILKFTAHHLSSSKPMGYEVQLKNPVPAGLVSVSGSFGPWNMDQVHATPVSGDYSYQDADLGTVEGIQGKLASTGKFRGNLERILIDGQTDVPDFQVKNKPHAAELKTQFHAAVEVTNGDVILNKVDGRLLRSMIHTAGRVAAQKGHPGKTTSLDFAVDGGRIQDLMLLFITEKRPPINGTVSVKGKTLLYAGSEPFLRRLQMSGDFGIEDASFTKAETQTSVDKFSESGTGHGDDSENPEDVVSDLQGHVVLQNGVATFSQLRFRVPGARARLDGTYNLITEKVDMRGMLYLDATLPKATSGIKSFLLKAIDPFLKKNRRGGARIPIRVTGTYEHPVYRADPV